MTLLTSILTACTTVGAGPAETNLRAGPVDPPIRIEASGPIQDPTATRLLRAAEAALDSDPTEAERLAQEVVRAHAAATGSSGALRILARLDYAQGSWESAEAFAVQYAALLPAGDDRAVVMRTLAGDAVLADGRPVDALNHWLTTPADADASLILGVLQRVEGAVEGLASDDLQRVLDDGAGPTPLWGAVAAHLALERYIEGDRETAVRLGQAAVDAGATGESARMARGVVSGDVSEFVFVPRIGMVLPTSGSPRLRDFADEILQGVQVAISQYGQATGSRLAVELVQRDNQGVVGNGLRIIADLESDGVLGIIGPLQDVLIGEMAAGRTTSVPIVTPTSPTVPAGLTNVYSLQGAEDGAARAVAQYAADRGIETAVLIYPDVLEATREAGAFRDAFGGLGGAILGEVTYSPGTTFFEEHMRSAAALDPDVVVFPVSAADVELLAPQVTFYGLDSLGIEVLGTSGWTDRDMLSRVDSRHTNGVIAASPQPALGESDAAREFRDAYEALFSNSLRSPVPAYGFDAAKVLLEVIESGARTGEEVSGGLSVLEGLDGATGRLSVQAGRMTRSHYVVCIQDQAPEDLPDGERPSWTLFAPLPDRETDSIPEGATPRIVGFRCPGARRPSGSLDDLLFHPDSAFLRPDTIRPDTTALDTILASPRRRRSLR